MVARPRGTLARNRSATESRLLDELRRLVRLSLPVMAAQVGGMLLGTVDTIMVGRVGVDALAAASIGNTWVWSLLFFGQGIVMGIDPLVTQAHGAGRPEVAARAFQRGVVVALAVSVPICAALASTEEVLRLLGQSPALCVAAERYTLVQIPSVPFFLSFLAARQWLQGREIVRPTMWVTLVANVFNVGANSLLIFGGAGVPALGLVGAGIATALTRVFMLLGLVAWMRGFRLDAGAWPPLDRAVFAMDELGRILRIGLAVAIQLSLEIWAFSTSTLLAGRLGATELAAHTIALNMAALAFMAPLGISQGTVTRVGNLIGAGDLARAQRVAGLAMGLGGLVMTGSAMVFVVFADVLPFIYTNDAAAVAACAAILPIAAAFQVFDGVQVVGCGVLRGMGRTRPAAVFNLVGYWVVGLPLGAWLGLGRGIGLPGIWWGLATGLALVAVSLAGYVARRGPAHARPI